MRLVASKSKGREDAAARRLKADALALAEAGCFSLVLEAFRKSWAPDHRVFVDSTIGVGAGPEVRRSSAGPLRSAWDE